jgi:hypothetical protein
MLVDQLRQPMSTDRRNGNRLLIEFSIFEKVSDVLDWYQKKCNSREQ